MHTLKLVDYTPPAKQKDCDPRNSANNWNAVHSTTHNAKSEYAANVLLAKQANSKRS